MLWLSRTVSAREHKKTALASGLTDQELSSTVCSAGGNWNVDTVLSVSKSENIHSRLERSSQIADYRRNFVEK